MTAPALAGLKPPSSRRISAGITPAPGTTSRLPVWWGRTDWLQVEVAGALREHRDVCRAHHVAPDTVQKVAEGMAEFADSRTGRDCRPTNERLVEIARCSLSTVQRARRVLKELGLVVEVTAGRTNMTLEQRLVAHENGSSHRAIAAEFALCSRRDRRPQLVENRAADLQVVDRDTPPVGKVVRPSASDRTARLQSRTATRSTASRRAHTEKSRRRPGSGLDRRPQDLAEAVRRRLTWLRSTPTSRMVPLLTRFALAGWSAVDVDLAVRNALAARGRRGVPGDLRMPVAYLAALLRGVDVEDRPTVEEAWLADLERAETKRRLQLVTSTELCPHGQPGGDVPSPVHGGLPCPICRTASQQRPPG